MKLDISIEKRDDMHYPFVALYRQPGKEVLRHGSCGMGFTPTEALMRLVSQMDIEEWDIV